MWSNAVAKAASRSEHLSVARVLSVRWAATTMCRFSSRSTCSADQVTAFLFCTHSKYDTVTPPELARMAGMTSMPFSIRRRSPDGSHGALAASAMTLQSSQSACLACTICSSAPGMKTSTGVR